MLSLTNQCSIYVLFYFLVKNGDENDFAEKLQLLMKDENLRREMGEKARLNVERFLPENVVRNWDELFKKIVL